MFKTIPLQMRDIIGNAKAGETTSQRDNIRSFQYLSWSLIRESISLIEEIAVEDAEAVDAIGNVVRLGNSGVRWLVVSPNNTIGEAAQQELERWGRGLFSHRMRGGITAFVNFMLRQIVITGAGSCENKISRNLDGVDDVYPVDVRSLDFEYLSEYDKYVVKQSQLGNVAYLPELTYMYLPLATPLSGVPYPLPPLYAALEETHKLKLLMDAIRDGALKQKLLGLLTLSIKRMSRVHGQTDADYRQQQIEILNSVANEFSKSLQEGLFVHFDEISPNMLSFADVLSKWTGITEPFEKRTSRALNFAWIREQGTIASAYMSIILEKILSEIQSLQLIVSDILSYAAWQHLVLKGIPIISLRTTLDQEAIRIWDKIKVQVDTFEKLQNMGVVDRYTIGRELGYTPPEVPDNQKETTQSFSVIRNQPFFLLRQDIDMYSRYKTIYHHSIDVRFLETSMQNSLSCIGKMSY